MEQGSPLVDEGVEAGEDKEGHHGTESHEVVKHGLQVRGCEGGLTSLVLDVACLVRVRKATDEILQRKEPGGLKFCEAFQGHPYSLSRPMPIPPALSVPLVTPSSHMLWSSARCAMLPHLYHGAETQQGTIIVMDNSRREALTSRAVMKKFHGSSVPRPRMKKISQTALYL